MSRNTSELQNVYVGIHCVSSKKKTIAGYHDESCKKISMPAANTYIQASLEIDFKGPHNFKNTRVGRYRCRAHERHV